jgi:hypothetical protein
MSTDQELVLAELSDMLQSLTDSLLPGRGHHLGDQNHRGPGARWA